MISLAPQCDAACPAVLSRKWRRRSLRVTKRNVARYVTSSRQRLHATGRKSKPSTLRSNHGWIPRGSPWRLCSMRPKPSVWLRRCAACNQLDHEGEAKAGHRPWVARLGPRAVGMMTHRPWARDHRAETQVFRPSRYRAESETQYELSWQFAAVCPFRQRPARQSGLGENRRRTLLSAYSCNEADNDRDEQ